MGHVKNKNASKPWRRARWVIVYNDPAGKTVEEKGASTEAASERLLEMRERDVAKGCWSPLRAASGAGGNPTFAEYEVRHNARRIAQGKSLAVDGTEHGFMVNHVIDRVGHLRMDSFGRDGGREVIVQLLADLMASDLAPHTVLNIYGQLRVLFKWAVQKDKVCSATPCTLSLDMDELPRLVDKDPRWRERAKYTRAEMEALVTDPAVPPDRHMLYALEFLGMLRAGEASGRRWVDWLEDEEPLGKLLVVTQYDDEEVKTRRPRAMPVHPVLRDMLREYRDYWWPILYGRRPTEDDFIVPVRGRGKARASAPRPCRKVHTMYIQLQRDLQLLSFRRRREHDLRRTGISMARGGGANKDALKACTHGDKGDVIDSYTTWPWEDLCEAISCLRFTLSPRSRELRLMAVDATQSRQRGSRSGQSRARYGDAASGAPSLEAPLDALPTMRNHYKNPATPTGIEPGSQGENTTNSRAVSRTNASATVREKPGDSADADKAGTPGALALLDLRDDLSVAAARLRAGEVRGDDHPALAKLLDRARIALMRAAAPVAGSSRKESA